MGFEELAGRASAEDQLVASKIGFWIANHQVLFKFGMYAAFSVGATGLLLGEVDWVAAQSEQLCRICSISGDGTIFSLIKTRDLYVYLQDLWQELGLTVNSNTCGAVQALDIGDLGNMGKNDVQVDFPIGPGGVVNVCDQAVNLYDLSNAIERNTYGFLPGGTPIQPYVPEAVVNHDVIQPQIAQLPDVPVDPDLAATAVAEAAEIIPTEIPAEATKIAGDTLPRVLTVLDKYTLPGLVVAWGISVVALVVSAGIKALGSHGGRRRENSNEHRERPHLPQSYKQQIEKAREQEQLERLLNLTRKVERLTVEEMDAKVDKKFPGMRKLVEARAKEIDMETEMND